jgi:hypothetical protein
VYPSHIRLLDDLPITEILAIEDHKFDGTFLHVVFGSQSLLKPTSDQTGSDAIEGPEKATRGGEWESIKIPEGNSAYIPKLTLCPSLLTRPRLHNYREAIGPQNRVRNHSRNMKQCQQEHVRDRRQKTDQRSVHVLTCISSNTLWAFSGNICLSENGTRNRRAFQSGSSRVLPGRGPATIHTRTKKNQSLKSQAGL